MRKLLLILALIVVSFMNIHADTYQETDDHINFHRTIPDDDTKDLPRMPAFSPIYGVMSGDILAIYSKVGGEAEITVTDCAGTVIINEPVVNLTCGYMVTLPAETTGLTVSVIFNGVTYSATI